MGPDAWTAPHRSPAVYALSNYFHIYDPIRSRIHPQLRRPLMNMLPSRRVKSLLQIVDAISSNAVKVYTEKKCKIETANQLGEGGIAPSSAKDLMSILCAYRFKTSSSWQYVAGVADISLQCTQTPRRLKRTRCLKTSLLPSCRKPR